MTKKFKYLRFLGLGIVQLLILGELFARFYLGLGSPPLYKSDPDYEYIQVENQEVNRFGNLILTNEFSMRSKPLSDKDDIRILKIGDSVLNGGALTDHSNLATTVLEEKLSDEFNKNVRVMNLSAGSWGPDNAAAYIQKYGDFNAQAIVLVFSSHDLNDNMNFSPVVGIHDSYPNKKPLLALWEGFDRYLKPRLENKFSWLKQKPQPDFNKIHGINVTDKEVNTGWKFFADYSRQHGIPMTVVLHPTIREIEDQEYNSQGQEIIAMMENENIEVIREMDYNVTKEMYRDDIHYNEKGQAQLVEEVYPWLEKKVRDLVEPPVVDSRTVLH